MRWVLALIPILLVAQDAFGARIDFGSRLSGENILLFLAIALTAFRIGQGRVRIELAAIQGWFLFLVIYAVLSWAFVSFLVQYPGYPIKANAFLLKKLLIDHFLIYLVFFYGPRTKKDAVWVLKVLLLLVFGVQILTIAETFGFAPTSFVDRQHSGRIEGLIGEANQSASFAALFAPAILAMATLTRGVPRGIWFIAALSCALVFVLTASRGASVGVLAALVTGGVVFRDRLRTGHMVRWVGRVMILLGAGVALASIEYGALLYQRFIADTFLVNVNHASMGRTTIWLEAIDKMLAEPITLVTGFGWRVYWVLPNTHSPHNTYLELWFNLGIVGVASYLAIFAITFSTAARAARRSTDISSTLCAAFVFAAVFAATTLFFVEWYQPWAYFWAYAGISMRLSSQRSEIPLPSAGHVGDFQKPYTRDEFGWSIRK